jgi:hypothetical protein
MVLHYTRILQRQLLLQEQMRGDISSNKIIGGVGDGNIIVISSSTTTT